MMQIIGWILCLYLIVKAFELVSMKCDDHKFARPTATAGAVIALVGAGVFFIMINEQARESSARQQETMSNIQDSLAPSTYNSQPDYANAVTNADIGQNIVFPKSK